VRNAKKAIRIPMMVLIWIDGIVWPNIDKSTCSEHVGNGSWLLGTH